MKPIQTCTALVAILALAATRAMAQSNPECAPYSANSQAQNLCDVAVDATHYFHPQLGLAISGGNPIPGSFRPLGGLGHFTIGLRATAFKTATPDLSYDGTGPTPPSVPLGDSIPLGAPTVDIGIGLFKGLSHGLLAVDALGSFVFVPNDQKDLHVDPSASKAGNFSYKLGYGARVGILRGSFPIPSISASWMHREIPTVTIGDVPAGDQYSYQLGLTATNFRLMAGWHLAIFDIGGGLGKDKYTGNAVVSFNDPTPVTGGIKNIPIALDNSRTTFFADLGINLAFLKIGAEIGTQTTSSLNTVSDFQGIDVKKGHKYASAGIRFQF